MASTLPLNKYHFLLFFASFSSIPNVCDSHHEFCATSATFYLSQDHQQTNEFEIKIPIFQHSLIINMLNTLFTFYSLQPYSYKIKSYVPQIAPLLNYSNWKSRTTFLFFYILHCPIPNSVRQ